MTSLFHAGQIALYRIRADNETADNEGRLYIHCRLIIYTIHYRETYDEMKENVSIENGELAECFDATFVRGKVRRRLRNGACVRSPPLFPPNLWLVRHYVLNGLPCAQNNMEAWHRMKFEMSSGKLETTVNESNESSRRPNKTGTYSQVTVHANDRSATDPTGKLTFRQMTVRQVYQTKSVDRILLHLCGNSRLKAF
uniref:Uncharacterized protein n=1 Tax=Trichuris muris TaxID=70415 RepID=A0A5S6QL66_TRIMR